MSEAQVVDLVMLTEALGRDARERRIGGAMMDFSDAPSIDEDGNLHWPPAADTSSWAEAATIARAATDGVGGLDTIRPIAWPMLEGRQAPPRKWIIPDWIGAGYVTSLYGVGGIGKSLLAQQAGTACAIGTSWLGVRTDKCRVLGVFCEDDDDELWRRQERINAAAGLRMADLGDFQVQGRVGMSNMLMHVSHGLPGFSPFFDELDRCIAVFKPGLVILDNIAQMYGANENERAPVTAFVNALSGLGKRHDCGVLLLGHPGKALGAEYSGNTAWDAAVRARLTLERVTVEGESKLKLRRPKANYSDRDEVELVWQDGIIRVADPRLMTDADKQVVEARKVQAQRAFLEALDRLRGQRRAVSDSSGTKNYAPKAMRARLDDMADFSVRELENAMRELFNLGLIRANGEVVKGADRKWRSGIVRTAWEAEVEAVEREDRDTAAEIAAE
jgi:RecA-family ATPase